MKRAAHFLKKEGYLIYAPDIFPFKRMSLYQWASFLLKWRWKLNGLEWEKGDTARSFLGPHNIEKKLFYFHFYQDKDSFLKEVDHAGLEVKEIIEDHWILTFRDK
ncbi:MAG: hypothetical protein D6797_01380 [Bdellovibrio sp.]|nr:MAG: hypothetical protein D6797_01380 [Bdellovibrio sp.]